MKITNITSSGGVSGAIYGQMQGLAATIGATPPYPKKSASTKSMEQCESEIDRIKIHIKEQEKNLKNAQDRLVELQTLHPKTLQLYDIIQDLQTDYQSNPLKTLDQFVRTELFNQKLEDIIND